MWYTIKIDIRPHPVSIFSDPVLSGQFLKYQGCPLYTGLTVLECISPLMCRPQQGSLLSEFYGTELIDSTA